MSLLSGRLVKGDTDVYANEKRDTLAYISINIKVFRS